MPHPSTAAGPAATESKSIVLASASVSIPSADPRVKEPKRILSPLSLTLSEQRIAVIGANGSGKSTLLRLLNGLVQPSTGTVHVHGRSTHSDGGSVRATVGFVFTDPLSQLVMPTPLEDVELSLRRQKLGKIQRRETALAILADYNLEHLAHSSIYELSGGERQLVALATVLAVAPKVLVLDEPSTLLDLRNTKLLMQRLDVLPQQVIMSTHDLSLVETFQRVLVIDNGQVAYDGGPREAIGRYRELVA